MECEKENVKMWKKKVRRRRKKMNSFKILPLSLLILSLFFLLWKERKKEKRKKWKAKRKKKDLLDRKERIVCIFLKEWERKRKKKELQILKNREEIGIAFLESRKNVKEKGSINEKKCRTKSDKSRKKKWLFVSSFFSLYLFLFSLFSSKKRKWLWWEKEMRQEEKFLQLWNEFQKVCRGEWYGTNFQGGVDILDWWRWIQRFNKKGDFSKSRNWRKISYCGIYIKSTPWAGEMK